MSSDAALRALAQALKPFLDEIGPGVQLIDQRASRLGSKRHCRAVRARIARGEPGASTVGRNYYLTAQAHDDELARLTRSRHQTAKKPRAKSREEQLADKLGLKLVSGGTR